MKFIVLNYSCLQNPWLGGYRPQTPFLSVLCPQLNLLNPPKKIPGYATGVLCSALISTYKNVRCHNSDAHNIRLFLF